MGEVTYGSNDTNIVSTISDVNVVHTDEGTVGSHTLTYVIVPLGAIALVLVLAFVIVFVIRKNRIERLRHHLMPLYNFDPQEEDWESELLDDRGRRMYNKEMSPSSTSPQLQFNT
ncbi:hypothetical protein ACF0H5_014197 [Mactra antiquata]